MSCRALSFSICIALMAGCASRPKSAPARQTIVPATTRTAATRPTINGPPIIDVARGGAGFPLEDPADLQSPEKLKQSLLKSYQSRFALPQGKDIVKLVPKTLPGSDRPSFDLVQIDLTDSQVRDNYQPSQYRAPVKPEPGIYTDRFEYRALPLKYENGATYWRLSATEAHMALLRRQRGENALVLEDAKVGSFEFSVHLADIKPMMMGGAEKNKSATAALKDVDVEFQSDGPKSLSLTLTVKAVLFFVPTTVRLHARADIDEWCNVRFSEMWCQGLDGGGVLVAAIANPALQKYNGRVQPLVRWPGDRIVLHDVRIRLDDTLGVMATFGRDPDRATVAPGPASP